MIENLDTNAILVKLEERKKEHKQTYDEVEFLQNQQYEIIQALLEKMRPVFEWYDNNRLVFTHPSIKLKSNSGPILGYVESEHQAIVYNVGEKRVEKVYLQSNSDTKKYLLYNLVRDGHFKEAYDGLMYLPNMINEYIDNNKRVIQKLKADVEEII
ncbi:hypothetical protein [Rossellomorea marisflavi]|uniref:hypothetical protein n=1 Tax=Rossellomorea marisflavi TaxID=189381 RepID=UPI003D2EDF51